MVKTTKAILATLLIAVIAVSCNSMGMGTMNLGSKVKNLELGMTKEQVVNTLGKTYVVIGVSQTSEGAMETVQYDDIMSYSFYTLNFLNGRLTEWFVQSDRPEGTPPPPPSRRY